QAKKQPSVRSSGGNNLSRLASSRTGWTAFEPLGHRGFRQTAAGLYVDPPRPAGVCRAPGGLAAVFRRHGRSSCGRAAAPEARVISGYLEKLSAALSFDRALAQRVRQEVEDHLQQAIATDPSNGGIAAEQRAIAEFGDPQALAAQFAMISVAKHTRKLGIALILVIVGIFMAMKGRVAWYAVTGGELGHDMTPLARIVGSMDRYSFWLSVIIGSGSFAYGVAR